MSYHLVWYCFNGFPLKWPLMSLPEIWLAELSHPAVCDLQPAWPEFKVKLVWPNLWIGKHVENVNFSRLEPFFGLISYTFHSFSLSRKQSEFTSRGVFALCLFCPASWTCSQFCIRRTSARSTMHTSIEERKSNSRFLWRSPTISGLPQSLYPFLVVN